MRYAPVAAAVLAATAFAAPVVVGIIFRAAARVR